MKRDKTLWLVMAGALVLMDGSHHVAQAADDEDGLGKYEEIVERNPFAVIQQKAPQPDQSTTQDWAKDLKVTGIVTDPDSGKLAVLIEETTSKAVYYCVAGNAFKDDLKVASIDENGNKFVVHVARGTQTASLDFEIQTSGTSAVGSAPVPPGTRPGSMTRPPIPIRRPPMPIRR